MEQPQPIACSACFHDEGLRLEAEQLGIKHGGRCPHCGSSEGAHLSLVDVKALVYRFFVWGSLLRVDFGGAPRIQVNESQSTSIDPPPWLAPDVRRLEKLLGVGFFHYGPRLWMLGEIEPLVALLNDGTRDDVTHRILREYPEAQAEPVDRLYRIRKKPRDPGNPSEYDSPPPELSGKGRLDHPDRPVLYASPDLQVCVHECRVTAEDDLYVATLTPTRTLRLLNLCVVLDEPGVTEFESLDLATNMLFLAGEHAYGVTRDVARAAREAGFDGVIYPSYFSLLRLGVMPFETAFGLAKRGLLQFKTVEEAKGVQNLALFGRPIAEHIVRVTSINRLVLKRVHYEFHFGPASF